MLGEKGLRVELHALHGELAVAHAHDLAVFGFRRDLQALWQGRPANRERMIAGRHEGTRQSAKHPEARMADRRGFPVHDLARMHDLAAESLADRLMTEAHALARVSCNSLSGTGSATIPAPACTCIWPPFTTAVRIAIARSISPLNPR